MRAIFILITLLFWAGVLAFKIAGRENPGLPDAAPIPAKTYTPAEVALHNQPENCWMTIGGVVYALTTYLPDHPARTGVIENWCGKEATEAYRTKLRDRAHTPRADTLLEQYRLGSLAPPGQPSPAMP